MKYTFKPWHILIYVWIISNIVLYFKGYNILIFNEEDTDLICLIKMADIVSSFIIGVVAVLFLVESDYIITIKLWDSKNERETKRRKIAKENIVEQINLLDFLIIKEDDPIELKRFINQKEKLTNMLQSL